ncbi:MAG TPA: transglycosylase domain-containing protein [Candidatus Saccharimonadales bacterium]|nr:transglycosylase domain-containing protein [Candidatus Saccharimonadales bacterium]
MSTPSNGPRRRTAKNTFTTKSGSTFKVNRSFSDRVKARRDAKARRRAMYLSTLPKNRFKRILYRLHPKRVIKYWFSRDGLIMALKIAGIGIVACFILIIGLFAYFRKDLPNIKDISGTNVGGSITYYDRTGQTVLWQDYDGVKRVPIPGNQISPYMKQATVAIEDKDFYKHGAFDVRGILRAGLHDVFGGGGTQGGSTITQQLVKLNKGWTGDQSIARKIKEVILAVEVEREYSKDDILTGYLNLAPYSGVDYGVETAARDYFNVDAKDLTLSQAAMLAAIPKAPTSYSPYSSPVYNPAAGGYDFDANGLIARQHYILDQMAAQKMITQAQADEAKKVEILAQVHPAQPKYDGIKAPYFVLAAKSQLEQKYSAAIVNRGGWKVVTTLDLNLQNLAEQQVQADKKTILRQGGDEAAFVAEDNKTGQIVSLVGGFDFSDPDHGSINYAHDVNISPGSSFKPYDYATFIDNNNNVGAGSVLYDQPGAPNVGIPGYPCTHPYQNSNNPGDCARDYDGGTPGAVTLRYALGGSRNIPAMKAMLSAVPNDSSPGKVNSVNKTISTADALMANPSGDSYHCYTPGTDIFTASKSDETQCYTSSAIGDGAYLHLDDQVNGIASIARMGVAIPRTYILKITDSSNKVIDEFKQPTGKQVLKPDTAFIMNSMASDPRASYLPGNCTDTSCTPLSSFGYKFHRYKGWNFAVKTGTTNYAFDGLMESWSTQYTAVTWVGYHTRTVAMTGNMETMTEPIVRGWMQGAHDMLNVKPTNWAAPSDIKTLPAFILSHKMSRNGEQIPSPSTDLFPSWYQQPKTGTTSSQTIDVVSGKLATSCTPQLAQKVISGSNDNAFSADIFVKGASTATVTGNDDVHNCNDTKPSVTLTAPQTCSATSGCNFVVVVTQGTAALSSGSYPGTVNLMVNGQKVQSQQVSDSPSTVTFSYTPTSSGQATVSAQVIDSVLYDATDTTTVNFTDAGT